MFGTPVFFVVAVVAIFTDKYCDILSWMRSANWTSLLSAQSVSKKILSVTKSLNGVENVRLLRRSPRTISSIILPIPKPG